MTKSVALILTCFFLAQGISFAQSVYPANYFSSPLDIPLVVIGTFGEIRADHFHSGLDLSTNEQEGKKVYAAASGYVSRIKIAPDGFGKAIYITHPNGYVTVYAHLKKFNPVIEKYIHKLQYEKESFAIDQYSVQAELPVKKGEVIAYSGSTGGAEGPHLHFEIRDAKTEWPINPLFFGFKIPDNIPPKISRLKIYSLHSQGVVINAIESATYKVSNESGENKILGPQVINVFGSIGLGIEAEDKKMDPDVKEYSLGIYSIEMKVDGNKAYSFRFDKFSFDETRYANAHVDYEEETLHNAKIQRCYRLPGNKLSIDADPRMSGELNMNDGKMHDIEFTTTDFAGNTTSMHLALQSETSLASLPFPSPPDDATIIDSEKGININTYDINLRIPAGAVYDETWFSFSKSSDSKNALSSLHHVGDKTVAVNNPLTIEIKVTANIPASLQQKTFIISHGKNGVIKYEGGEWKNGFVSASVRHFGDFEVMLDTIPPTIKVIEVPVSGSPHENLQIAFQVKDNLSGMESYRATIDGKFFLLEFDAKTGMLAGEIPNSKTDKKHNFALSVSDKKGNNTLYEVVLIY